MRSRKYSMMIVAVFATFGIIGLVDSVGAAPDGSQKLRGLGGRVFFVEVQDLFAGTSFDNCYFFYPDGTWVDPPFPVAGSWNQDSVGAKTSYTAGALAEDFDLGGGFIVDLSLEQVGNVTPAGGKGNLQLWAFSQAFFVDFLGEGEDLLVGEFVSIGYEVDECPL